MHKIIVQVTKPYLPDRVKYKKYIDGIYDRCQLTNHGILVHELEKRLAEYLGLTFNMYLLCVIWGLNGVALLVMMKRIKYT